MKKLWVITCSVNDYNQHGDYLIAVFTEKPTMIQLDKIFPNPEAGFYNHLLNGGGRIRSENMWYYLTEIGEGESYEVKS